jgi:hypothetical protein
VESALSRFSRVWRRGENPLRPEQKRLKKSPADRRHSHLMFLLSFVTLDKKWKGANRCATPSPCRKWRLLLSNFSQFPRVDVTLLC